MIYLIALICGILNGFMDAILQHDAYAKWGHFFSKDSWKDRYEHPTIFSQLMVASINAWHVAKWLTVLLFILGFFFTPDADVYESILLYIGCIYLFIIGFKISYA
jgi:hypothetical protein